MFRKWKYQIKFAFRYHWIVIVIALFAVCIFSFDPGMRSFWDGKMGPIIGLSTLFVAISVWWGEVREDWRERLPKRMTVRFMYKNKEVMCCEKAHLFSEADMRQLGQQIGAQMTGARLAFAAPDIRLEKSFEIVEDEKVGGFIVHHEIVFYLTELPDNDRLTMDKCQMWTEPFLDGEGRKTYEFKDR